MIPKPHYRDYREMLKTPLSYKSLFKQAKFYNFSTLIPGLTVYKCQLNLPEKNMQSFGYSESFFIRSGYKISFFEAFERMTLQHYPEVKNSNGIAAGITRNETILRSKCEYIERYILRSAWDSKKGWRKVKVQSKLVKGALLYLKNLGWNIRYYKISTTKGIMLVAHANHKTNGSTLDSTFAFNKRKIFKLERKLLTSLLRAIAARGIVTHSNQLPTGPADTSNFYWDIKNASAFNFLINPPSSTYKFDIDHISINIETKELNRIKSDLYVYRSNIEGQTNFFWGRNPEKGSNKWPLPLA